MRFRYLFFCFEGWSVWTGFIRRWKVWTGSKQSGGMWGEVCVELVVFRRWQQSGGLYRGHNAPCSPTHCFSLFLCYTHPCLECLLSFSVWLNPTLSLYPNSSPFFSHEFFCWLLLTLISSYPEVFPSFQKTTDLSQVSTFVLLSF